MAFACCSSREPVRELGHERAIAVERASQPVDLLGGAGVLVLDLLDVGEHFVARFALGGVARLRDPQLLALLHALDLAPQRRDLALHLAPDRGFGFEAGVLGAQRLARFLRGAEVPGDRFLDVLDPVPTPVRRDRIEADGIDAEDRFGETVGLGPVGDEVVEEEFAARLVNAGPPCGRR